MRFFCFIVKFEFERSKYRKITKTHARVTSEHAHVTAAHDHVTTFSRYDTFPNLSSREL